jgi:hypothetical protein
VRVAARTLVKQPGFTFVVVLTLALGIGATTTIFSVVHGVLLRPLPYRDTDRVVTLSQWSQVKGIDEPATPANFLDWREASRLVQLVASGLLIRSFGALLQVDLGYRVDNRAALTLHVWDAYPQPERRALFIAEVETRMRQQPGVVAVGAASALPLSHEGSEMDPPYVVAGVPPPAPGDEPTALTTFVTPGLLRRDRHAAGGGAAVQRSRRRDGATGGCRQRDHGTAVMARRIASWPPHHLEPELRRPGHA